MPEKMHCNFLRYALHADNRKWKVRVGHLAQVKKKFCRIQRELSDSM
jgi:hypothetical protein